MGAPILLSDEHIAAAKAFVQELFDEGMDGVAVKVSQFNHSDDVEAFYLACDVEDGAVFLPKFFPTPVELISHELGHAVHHMLRRRSNPTDPAFWTGGQIEGELCAYYTQINYILEHGTRTQFYQALGALATFAAELVIDRATSSRLSLSDFLCDEDFAPYAGVSARDFVIRMFCALDRNFDKNGAKLFELRSSFPRGFGFALALKLIDERESMRNFMAIDSCSVPLDQKLSMAFPHRRNLDKLDDLPHVIARLAERLSD
ncbi:hypothetical protein [Cupriavidus necator]|uniref:hypothetical protein n=1 Tax=Cupriavidus necator TaxID=106590 RepID=UPI003F732BAD